MIYARKKFINDLLCGFFLLFIFASTFSIALAQVALGVSLLLFIVAAAATKYIPFLRELRCFYICVGLYIFWMFLSAIVGETPLASILILKEEWLFCVVPISLYLLVDDRYRKLILIAFAIGTGLITLYGILQAFTGIHWFKDIGPPQGPEFGYKISGNFSAPMTFANYFGTAGGFFAGYLLAGWQGLDKRRRAFYGIVVLVTLLAILGTYNRGAMLGLFVAFVVLILVLRSRKALVGVIAVALLALIIVTALPGPRDRIFRNLRNEFDPQNDLSRVYIWTNSLKIAAKNPVFGVGQGNFRNSYLEYLPEDVLPYRERVHAHNDLLNIAAIAGVPGMIFFAGIWISVFGYLRRGWKTIGRDPAGKRLLAAALTGSVVFLVTSVTEATFADEEVRQMLMFVWAVGLFQLLPSKPRMVGNHGAATEVKALDN